MRVGSEDVPAKVSEVSSDLNLDAIAVVPGERNYSPYPGADYPSNVYFGDTHTHTSYSADAGMTGTALGPEEAFKFAKGETVVSNMGVPARLEVPLDWLVVADHAEGLGLAPLLTRSDPDVLKDPLGQELYELMALGTVDGMSQAFNLFTKTKMDGTNTLVKQPELFRPAWEDIVEVSEAANNPGQFTAFIGFEWSSAPGGSNLHRVVVYKEGKEVAGSQLPLSADLNPDPEYLWDWMEQLQNDTGGHVLAIPHNGNLSNGVMFSDVKYTSGEPIDQEYARRRQIFEPLVEVTQMKGTGEAHPLLSPDDEFADFEIFDNGSLGGQEKKTTDMFQREYAREALKRGLAYQRKLGTNPFKFGMIGSTDTHTALATTQENNFFGKVAQLEPTDDEIRFEEAVTGRIGDVSQQQFAWQTSASGLTAVWAKENTREAIWEAMARKEVYATTGTRLKVRVFAGFNFDETDLQRSNFVQHGYEGGVPMGGDLNRSEQPPKFLIRAIRDANGANLDRVQIVKGWLDETGEIHEHIYDVAVSDGRKIGKDGRCKTPVGNTVNVEEASYSNAIGAPFLETFWEDPEFNPEEPSFYYIRVLEIPTPRWTTYDAKIFGVEIPEGAPTAIQDRAFTSPIWYNPK